MFAKLYETEVGQILVKLDEGDKGPQINIYFEPKGLGVCSIDFDWESADKEVRWEKADKAFDMMTEESCFEMIKNIIDELVPPNDIEDK